MKKKRKKSDDDLLRIAMQQHAASGAAWERDFGDRPVVNYDTGEKVAETAREYRRKMSR